ncbi:MAG TPA: GNAT family N-acetyltransferase [Planctomycetota bacterium]|jgi:GNAT superfamily N-acetyltransferase|nr:GNAT family N-acetyltransferase [Planctomycetota bacterium]
MATIVRAQSSAEIEAVRGLIAEYVEWLGIDLSYQSFPQEFAALPWRYAPPRGELLLALEGGEPAGCVALKPIDADSGEFKRFFVRPRFRGRGIGLDLGRAIVDRAREIGYRRMRLDTLPSMCAAVAVYRALGFRPIPAYHDTPVTGTLFMELDLCEGSSDNAISASRR